MFLSNAVLAALTSGTVDALAGVIASPALGGPADLFVAATAEFGAGGSEAPASIFVFTSTPCPAFAQGACAGALLTIVSNLPGAAIKPFCLSYKVSVCASCVNDLTSAGVVPVAPVLRLIFDPLIYVTALLANDASPLDAILIGPVTL